MLIQVKETSHCVLLQLQVSSLSLQILKKEIVLDWESVLNEIRALYLIPGTAVKDSEFCHTRDIPRRTNTFPSQAVFCIACDRLRNPVQICTQPVSPLFAKVKNIRFPWQIQWGQDLWVFLIQRFTVKVDAHWWVHSKNMSNHHLNPFEFWEGDYSSRSTFWTKQCFMQISSIKGLVHPILPSRQSIQGTYCFKAAFLYRFQVNNTGEPPHFSLLKQITRCKKRQSSRLLCSHDKIKKYLRFKITWIIIRNIYIIKGSCY